MGDLLEDLSELRSRVAGVAAPPLPGSPFYLAAAELLELAAVALHAARFERALMAPEPTPDELRLRGELILARERLARDGSESGDRLRRAS